MNESKPVIAFANTNKAWGGGEKWFAEVIEQLQSDFHIKLYTAPKSEILKRVQLDESEIFTLAVGNLSWLNPFKIFRLYRQFKKDKPRLLIMNLPSDVKSFGLAAYLAKIPNRIYRRGSAIAVRNSISNRWLFKNVIQEIITNSECTAKSILQNNPLLFPKEKIHVIYNGIELDKFDEELKGLPLERKRNQLILGNAGRLEQQKGHELLVELAEILEKKEINFIIKIAGEGSKREELEKLIRVKKLQHRFVLQGFTKDIAAFMNSLDIYVHSAHWEGFGFVLTEAMAARKAVVAFDISSNPEIVKHEVTGYLTTYANMEQMAEKIIYLYKNPDFAAQMGLAGRQYVEQNFKLENTTKQLKALISKMISAT